MKNHQRKSNFELMRIISMFMIIINHILDRKLTINTTGTTQLVIFIINVVIRVHVCSFVILTGYFQCKNRFKLSKVIALNNAVWFYNIFYFILLTLFGLISLGKVDILLKLSPISYADYWFVTIYLLLYFISPLLNIIINHINKKQFQMLIMLLVGLFSIIPSITRQVAYNNNAGFSLANFILLYFIGAYLRLYPLKKSFLFKKFSDHAVKLISMMMFFFFAILNLLIYYFSNTILPYGNILNYIGNVIKNIVFSYDNPILIIQSIFYFFFFESLIFKNRVINKISKYVFGIYLVHENPLITPFFYKWLGFTKDFYTISVIPKIFICAIIIFIVSLVIEIIRSLIFKFIYHRKFSRKFRYWYREYIKLLGFEINW